MGERRKGNVPTAGETRFGELAPRYSFIINPYPYYKVSKCPMCEQATGQRKVPLLIHVDPARLIALNYTCRYCRRCDLLVAHKHEIEHLLHDVFRQLAPQAIGNDYLVLGTVEKAAWREGFEHPKTPAEIIPCTHDFKEYLKELRMTQGGWFPRDMEPPEAKPPESREWVKSPVGGSPN